MTFWKHMVGAELTGSFRQHSGRLALVAGAPFVVGSLCLAPLLLIPSYGSVTIKPIAQGVTLTEEIDRDPPEIIHVLTIDLTRSNVHLEPIPAQDSVTGPTGDIHHGREEVRSIATRHGAVAAVNGDYFPFTGDPLGAAVWNGDLYSEPYPGRCVMGIETDGRTVLFDTVGFLGEVQTQQNNMIAISGVDRMVSATDTNDLVVFTPTFGPRTGIRPGCVEVILSGVNLPLRPSKLLTGTVSTVNVSSQSGSSIPSNGVILSALPGGQAGNFLTTNFHLGDQAEFVCSIAPQAALADAVRLAMSPRDPNDLPSRSADFNDVDAYNWATVGEAIGGGPHLIVDGQVSIDGSQEGFKDSFIDDPNPRTGVGITADGKLLLITVDGRQSLSRGMSLNDFAVLFKRYGAFNAMNLDGGGSTTMVADGLVVNSLASTGVERPVANSLCVFAPPLFPQPPSQQVNLASSESSADMTVQTTAPIAQYPGSVPAPAIVGGSTSSIQPTTAVGAVPTNPLVPTITGLPASIDVGQTEQLSLAVGSQVVSGSDPHVIWGGSVDAGIAFVDQSGQLTALKSGQGIVTADYMGEAVQQQITIQSNSPASAESIISASLTALDEHDAQRSLLLIGVFDPQGMPVPSATVQLTVTGGTVDKPSAQTDVDGEAQAKIIWRKNEGGSVTVTSEGLVSKTLEQP